MEGSSKTNRPAALTRDSLHDELQQRPAAAHIAMLDRARKQSAEKSASREPGRSQLQTPVPPSPLQYSASLGDSDTSKQTNSSNSDTSLEPTREKTSDAFKLQDAPKRRRTGSRGSMMSLGLGIENVPGADSSLLNGSLLLDSQSTLTPGPRNPNRLSKAASETSTILAERPAATPAQKSENTTDRTQSTRRKKSRVEDDAPLATSMSVRSTDSTSSQLVHRPPRGDSLARHDSERHHRKENTGPVKSPRNSTTSNSAQPSPKFSVDGIAATSNLIRQALTKGHSNHVSEHPTPLSPKTTPSSAREGRSNSTETSNESKERVPGFLDDSSPSSPQMSNATSAYSEEAKASSTPPPDLLRYSGIGAFTMEDDISRILGATNDSHSAVRRRISTAMQRHGRSFSDNASQTPRKGRVSIHDGSQYDGGSPLHPPPSSTREHIALKSELRRSQQKIAELEARVSSVDDIRSLDTKLREKRSTMAFLDSQREVVLKEMDVFAAHHKRAKESRTPLTAQAFESEMLKSLARELDGLKTRYQPAIEELIHRREELTRQVDDLREEANHLAGQNDQLRKESDELYVKNSKLRDLNDELTGAIKKKSTIDRPPPFDGVGAHGLGIYNPSSTTFASKESKDGRIHSSHGGTHSGAANQLIGEDDHHIHTISTPQVINIRKAQAKKFNWRREGKATLGDMKKGIKSIVKSTNPSGGDVWQPSFVETLPYHQTQMGLGHGSHSNQMASQDGALPHTNLTRSMTIDHNFGLFGKKKQALSQTGKSQSNSNLLDTVAEPPTTLFGSELEARADYERTNIPSIITRCIAEVETRGMDAEGIYRRNGGHSQIRQIQEGVELNGDGHDISDPDLDICSITSILKQYLRNLPTPLITYEAYPDILKAQCKFLQALRRLQLPY